MDPHSSQSWAVQIHEEAFIFNVIIKRHNYGVTGSEGAYEQATPEQIKITKEKLKPNSDNIIIEKSKVVAKLRNEVSFGYTTISTKEHLPNDINAIDQET